MFEHSVKVPRHFKVAANILKKVSTEGGSVKTLLYDTKLRHFNTNVLFALITETIKHSSELDKIFEESSLIKNEPRLDLWLAKVLTTELLYGKKKLPGNSKPEKTILSYKSQFEKFTSEHQDVSKTEAIRRPRYVRINTNLLTTSDAIRAFQDEEYHFIRCTSGTYEDYLKQIQGLTEYDFTQDYHVKTIFVFPPGTKLHDHELYLENKIILQDKATALAVHLMAPPPGSVALDMCAAPGMKTTQLAAYMRNEGKIYAVERNETRYQTLCEFVEKTGSKCVETLHKDALEIKRGDFEDVEYILLDPSCSGSGMELSIHNYIDATRLVKLTSLQEKFLKHAMNSFPKAKRIVYSTCSVFPEENERVITNIVKNSRSKWRVQDCKELLKGQWNNFGSGMYGSIGTRCLYAKPDSDFTTGFFLAVLDRDPKDLERNSQGYNVEVAKDSDVDGSGDLNEVKSKTKLKKADLEEVAQNIDLRQDVNETNAVVDKDIEVIKKKNKKNKHSEVIEINNKDVVEETTDCTIKVPSKKKKKKNKHTDLNESNNHEEAIENSHKKADDGYLEGVNNTGRQDVFKNIESGDTGGENNKNVKKKKKHKLTSEIVDTEGLIRCEDYKKRHKSKNKHNDVENNISEELEPVKKKKKKKSTNVGTEV